jgi:hypothetical protein
MGNFPLRCVFAKSYKNITACGTYVFCRFLVTAPPIFFDENSVATDVLGILPAVLFLVFGPGSVDFFLLRVNAVKVIGML